MPGSEDPAPDRDDPGMILMEYKKAWQRKSKTYKYQKS